MWWKTSAAFYSSWYGKESTRLSIWGDLSFWLMSFTICVMNAGSPTESCRTRTLSGFIWLARENRGRKTPVQFISVNMCSQIVLRLHFDGNFELASCGTICERSRPACPLAAPLGAWSQLLVVARSWIGLGKRSVCKIIPFLFTGVLYRQITSLIWSTGRVQKCLCWHTGSRGGGGDRIAALHTHCQFHTLELQPK